VPLWNVYHPEGAYTDAEKNAFAERITKMYTDIDLPKFYVNVIFQEIPKRSFYIGAEPVGNFVRITVVQIARTLPTDELRGAWLRVAEEAVRPYVQDRGYDWEFHIDETPADLWTVQGIRPPAMGSDAERRWAREGQATPHTDPWNTPETNAYRPTERTGAPA
jgi:phenylpyruvate tautomerase PptA (4-oxalocrotonate tautomerase family)